MVNDKSSKVEETTPEVTPEAKSEVSPVTTSDSGKNPVTFADFLAYQQSQGLPGAVPVAPPKPHAITECWNCHNEQLGEFKGDHDVCSKCGFDRTKIFNLALLEK